MWLPIGALCTVPFIMVLGNSMLIPVLPKIREVLKLSQFRAGLLITAFSVPAGIVITFVGVLSDRIGRKNVMAPSLILYGVAGVLAGLAALLVKRPYWWIFGARILQGIGAAGTAPVAMALVGDLFNSQERSKVLGIVEASNGMGKVLSPVLGSGIALITWYMPFFFYGILAVPSAIAVWTLCPEKRAAQKPPPLRQYFQDLGKVFKQKPGSLISCYLAGGLILFTLFGILFYFSDKLETVWHYEGLVKGLLIALPVAAMAGVSLLAGSILQKRVNLLKWATLAGLVLVAGPLFLLCLVRQPLLSGGLLVVLGVGNGLALPAINTMVTSAAAGETRGMVTSVYGAVRFMGVALGPPLFGWLMARGQVAVFLPVAIVVSLAFVVTLFFLKVDQVKPPQGQGQGQPPAQGKGGQAPNQGQAKPKGKQGS